MKVFVSLLLLCCGFVYAENKPSPRLSAKQVLQIQLSALQFNDSPSKNAGIEMTWRFAHPDNKRATGPLQVFTAMIQSPHYKPLLNHSQHMIKNVEQSSLRNVFQVDVQKQDGRVLRFIWVLEKVTAGQLKGCWMTTAVSVPRVVMEGV